MEVFVRTSIFSRVILGLLMLALCFIPQLPCQQLATGNISGVATDPSGRALSNVKVTLTNASQGTEHSYKTGDDGVFSFATKTCRRGPGKAQRWGTEPGFLVRRWRRCLPARERLLWLRCEWPSRRAGCSAPMQETSRPVRRAWSERLPGRVGRHAK